MKRLRDLEVHEVSIVGLGANGKKYLVLKNQKGATDMAVPYEQLQSLFAKVPKKTLEAVAQVAKSARIKTTKADEQAAVDAALDGPDGLTEQDAQDAILSAGRMLAPFADMLTPEVLQQIAEAVGMTPSNEEVNPTAVDPAIETPVAMAKADDDAEAKDDDKAEDGKATKADAPEDTELATADEVDPDAPVLADGDDVQKEDAAASEDDYPEVDGDMPDFSDASDADREAALAAARDAYAQAMKQRGVGKASKNADGPGIGGKENPDVTQTTGSIDDSGVPPEQTNGSVNKSANGSANKTDWSGFTSAQRAALEPVLKSQTDALAALQAEHKQAVKKSAELSRELQHREYVAKANKEYSALGNAPEIADALMRVKDPEALKAMQQVLKAANAQAKAGGEGHLFGEYGTRNAGVGNSDQQAEQALKAFVAKSAGKTKEQAEAEFWTTGPGRVMYAQSRRDAEKRKG